MKRVAGRPGIGETAAKILLLLLQIGSCLLEVRFLDAGSPVSAGVRRRQQAGRIQQRANGAAALGRGRTGTTSDPERQVAISGGLIFSTISGGLIFSVMSRGNRRGKVVPTGASLGVIFLGTFLELAAHGLWRWRRAVRRDVSVVITGITTATSRRRRALMTRI